MATADITSEVFPIRAFMTGAVCAYGARIAVDGRMVQEITSFRTFMEAFDAAEIVVAELVG